MIRIDISFPFQITVEAVLEKIFHVLTLARYLFQYFFLGVELQYDIHGLLGGGLLPISLREFSLNKLQRFRSACIYKWCNNAVDGRNKLDTCNGIFFAIDKESCVAATHSSYPFFHKSLGVFGVSFLHRG